MRKTFARLLAEWFQAVRVHGGQPCGLSRLMDPRGIFDVCFLGVCEAADNAEDVDFDEPYGSEELIDLEAFAEVFDEFLHDTDSPMVELAVMVVSDFCGGHFHMLFWFPTPEQHVRAVSDFAQRTGIELSSQPLTDGNRR